MTWTDQFTAWLESDDIKVNWLAYKLGVSAVAIHYWKHGSVPHEARRKKIELLSKGRVKAQLPPAKKTGT